MRHWASPEVNGLRKADAMWHKGDFFNDFMLRLPCIPKSDFQHCRT